MCNYSDGLSLISQCSNKGNIAFSNLPFNPVFFYCFPSPSSLRNLQSFLHYFATFFYFGVYLSVFCNQKVVSCHSPPAVLSISSLDSILHFLILSHFQSCYLSITASGSWSTTVQVATVLCSCIPAITQLCSVPISQLNPDSLSKCSLSAC